MAHERKTSDLSTLLDRLQRIANKLDEKDFPSASIEIDGALGILEPTSVEVYLKGGYVATWVRDYGKARGLFVLAADISQRIGNEESELWAIIGQIVLIRTGQDIPGFSASIADAYPLRKRGTEILEHFPENQGADVAIEFLIESALIERVKENYARVIDILDQARLIGERALEYPTASEFMSLLGKIHFIRGDVQGERGYSVHAQTEFIQAYEYYRMTLDKTHMGKVALTLAEMYEKRQDFTKAKEWYQLVIQAAHDAEGRLIDEAMAQYAQAKITEMADISSKITS